MLVQKNEMSSYKTLTLASLQIERKIYVEDAHSFTKRLRGLIGREKIDPDYAYYIYPCSAIHTVAMRFAIDAVFVDKHSQIRKIVSNLKPWRWAYCRQAVGVLEFSAGQAERLDLFLGQRLYWDNGVLIYTPRT